MLSFSLKSPPYIAVCIGDNYMLVFGTSGQHSHEDVGLTFPEDYGAISNPNPNPSPNPNPTLTLTQGAAQRTGPLASVAPRRGGADARDVGGAV